MFTEERRDESASGEDGPLLAETDRRDAVDWRFWRAGIDLRRSSRRELVLGMRRGAGWLGKGRDETSWGDKREGEVGSGVAVAFASVRRFKESESSQCDGGIVAWLFWLSMGLGGGSS